MQLPSSFQETDAPSWLTPPGRASLFTTVHNCTRPLPARVVIDALKWMATNPRHWMNIMVPRVIGVSMVYTVEERLVMTQCILTALMDCKILKRKDRYETGWTGHFHCIVVGDNAWSIHPDPQGTQPGFVRVTKQPAPMVYLRTSRPSPLWQIQRAGDWMGIVEKVHRREERNLAIAMATHGRLGKCSILHSMQNEIVQMISKAATEEVEVFPILEEACRRGILHMDSNNRNKVVDGSACEVLSCRSRKGRTLVAEGAACMCKIRVLGSNTDPEDQ